MPKSQSAPILIAAGAVASIVLAFAKRSATRKSVVLRNRRRREPRAEAQNEALENPQQATPPITDAAPLDEHNLSSQGRPTSRSAIPLLLHGLASIGLVVSASYWHPTIIPDEESWRQLVGSILIVLLSIHSAIFYLLPPRRREPPLAPPTPPPTARPETIDALNGVWMKDKEASDSMDPVCDLMRLNGLLRMAIGLIKGAEIFATPGESFRMDVLSGVLWFKIKEKYNLTGEEAKHRRRDFRGGEKKAVNFKTIW